MQRMTQIFKMNLTYFVQHHPQQFRHPQSNLDQIQVRPMKSKTLKWQIESFILLTAGSLRSPRQRRQRTTSINLNKTIDATESIIRANNRTIYTAGRPPWYNCAGQQVEPFVIGLFSFSYDIQYRKIEKLRLFSCNLDKVFAAEVHLEKQQSPKRLLKAWTFHG